MNFAIYARKSVCSDKSDSVKNQLQMCKDFIYLKFKNEKIFIKEFFDEGFSGKNTERPALAELMREIKEGSIDAIVVYQLDRLSRNVRDFSEIYGILEKKSVMFVSIKENIDTTTPIGKAMMYISMVFAQMERETIAQRVKDNMIGLAKKGYWTCGNPPIGYKTERVTVGEKTHVIIVPDKPQVEFVNMIFDIFLENNMSLSKMQTFCKKNNIKTLNGAFLSTSQIYNILSSPYVAPASREIFDFFNSQKCQMVDGLEQWNGENGVMVYGKTTKSNGFHEQKEKTDWIVSVGLHQPIISSEKWLSAQKKFNRNKFDKTSKYEPALLKGLLTCGKCGCKMKMNSRKGKGKVFFSYICEKRASWGKESCDLGQIKCEILDNKVLEILSEIEIDSENIKKYIPEEKKGDLEVEVKELERRSAAVRQKISRLTECIADGSGAAKYIMEAIEKEDMELSLILSELEEKRQKMNKKKYNSVSSEEKANEIAEIMKNLSGFSKTEKNAVMREIIKECSWDGTSLFLRF